MHLNEILDHIDAGVEADEMRIALAYKLLETACDVLRRLMCRTQFHIAA